MALKPATFLLLVVGAIVVMAVVVVAKSPRCEPADTSRSLSIGNIKLAGC